MDSFRDTINIFVDEPDSYNFSSYIEDSMFMIVRSHMWHLQTSSYSQHKALQEFYTSLSDLVDSLAESYLSSSPLTLSNEEYKFDDVSIALSSIEVFYDKTKEAHTQMSETLSLTNILEDILTLCTETLYKIKNLQ